MTSSSSDSDATLSLAQIFSCSYKSNEKINSFFSLDQYPIFESLNFNTKNDHSPGMRPRSKVPPRNYHRDKCQTMTVQPFVEVPPIVNFAF